MKNIFFFEEKLYLQVTVRRKSNFEEKIQIFSLNGKETAFSDSFEEK